MARDVFATGAPLRPIIDRAGVAPEEARLATRAGRRRLLLWLLGLPLLFLSYLVWALAQLLARKIIG